MSKPKLTLKPGTKSYLTNLWLSLFLGVLGADRFYLGKWKTGLLKLLTLGGLLFWVIYDGLYNSLGQVSDSEGKGLKGYQEERGNVKLSLIGLVIMVAIVGLIQTASRYNNTLAQSSHGNQSANLVLSLAFVFFGFGILFGLLLFSVYTIVDAVQNERWLWAIVNFVGFLFSFGILNLFYYNFVKNGKKKPTPA